MATILACSAAAVNIAPSLRCGAVCGAVRCAVGLCCSC